MEPEKRKNYARYLAMPAALGAVVLLVNGFSGLLSYKLGIVFLLLALSFGVISMDKLQNYAFTVWVLVCAAAAMLYPQTFIAWGDFRLELLIIPLTQIIMFGMGTTLSPDDFIRVTKSPWPVFMGMFLQFGVMPFVGYVLALSFGFDGELAAGIVLIGACSGGVASNLMVYLARGNVALSVTMTFTSTLVAPLATPFLMSSLAGTFVPIDAVQMMFSILNMIIVPVVAGLFAHEILYGKRPWTRKGSILVMLTLGSIAFAASAMLLGPDMLGPLYSGLMMGGALIAAVTLAKLVMSVLLGWSNTWMDKVLPLVAKIAICMVIAIIIAQTRDVLLAVGLSLMLAAILHNTIGYLLGYWGAWLFGMMLGKAGYMLGLTATSEPLIDKAECRTIAFEVGMQNAGMASGLAVDVLQSHVTALPPNIFGTWMNISGSVLANYWVQRPAKQPDRVDIETKHATITQ